MKRILAAILICFLSLNAFAKKPDDWNEPPNIREIISKHEAEAKLPKGLAHCIAYEESRFNPKAKSRWINGFQSVGLFQQYWKYIWELIEKFSDIPLAEYDWKNPDHSAEVGCNYAAYLINRFGSSIYLGMLAYNWGPGNLEKLRSYDQIPAESLKYADDILRLWSEWDPSW